MPSTVLQTLQDDGTYPDLYVGTNLIDNVPQDLYKQDWWYRTTFTAPAGHTTYTLEFPGINYRAEIWLNGHLIAGNKQIVGMHSAHELDVSRWVNQGGPNTLAVKVTPEQALQDVDGVELADSWYDWINWKQLGLPRAGKGPGQRQFLCPRPQCRHLEAGLSEGLRRGGDRSRHGEHRTSLAANRFREAHDLQQPAQYVGAASPWRSSRHDHPAPASPISSSNSRSPSRPGEEREVSFDPDRLQRARSRQSRSLVALHAGRTQPLRPAAGIPPVRPADRCQPSAVRHPHRHRNTATTTTSSRNWARAETSI